MKKEFVVEFKKVIKMEKMIKTIDVMMFDAATHRYKRTTLNEDVMEYLEIGTVEKVKEIIMKNLRNARTFNDYDVKDLWYKWDDFIDAWRKQRNKLSKEKRAKDEADEVEEVFEDLDVDFDIKKELSGEMKEEFLKMWKKKKQELKKKKKAAKKKEDVAD